MFPTRQAPPARPSDAWIDGQDRAGPDGEDEIDPIAGQRTALVSPPAQASPPDRPLGLQLDLVDGAGMASADRLRGFSMAVVVT